MTTPNDQPLTEEEINRLLELAQKATPGPYRYSEGFGRVMSPWTEETLHEGLVADNMRDNDAEYYAELHPAFVLRLIADLRRLRAASPPMTEEDKAAANALAERLYEATYDISGSDDIAAMAAILLPMVAELRHLRGIVSKMPATGDGVPITFGMTVWYWEEEADTPRNATWHLRGDFVETTITAIYRKNFAEYKGQVTVGVNADWEGGNAEVYSTRAAAEAALAHPTDSGDGLNLDAKENANG